MDAELSWKSLTWLSILLFFYHVEKDQISLSGSVAADVQESLKRGSTMLQGSA
jgi:hypothetical protein